MKTVDREESFVEWDKLWNSMKEEWFKIEVLQDYSAEDDSPSLRAWKDKDRQKSIELMKENTNREWIEKAHKTIKKGVKLIRIHIVERPLSQYVEWEIEHYKNINTSQVGEQVFLVEKPDIKNLNLPKGDIMLFDRKFAVANTYNANGLMVAATIYDANDDISEFLNLRDKLLEIAKPLAT